MNMIQQLFIAIALCTLHSGQSWTTSSRAMFSSSVVTNKSLSATPDASSPEGNSLTEGVDNPCWQDIWSYDCAMSTIYSASFIANDWIKAMPCASGLAVSFRK